MLKYFLTLITSFSLLNFSVAQVVLPTPLITDKIKNVFEPSRLQDAKVSASSYIGERMEINIEKRLLTLDLASILEPYIHRPGKQTWIGEHELFENPGKIIRVLKPQKKTYFFYTSISKI